MKKTSLLLLAFAFTLPAQAYSADEAASPAVAQVGDVKLSEKQMLEELSMAIFSQENQIYQLKRDWVNRQAKNILFDKAAKDAKLSRKKWEAKELAVAPPTAQELDEVVRRMVPANQMPTDPAKLAQVRQQGTDYLTNQKKTQKETEVFQSLTQKYPLQITLAAPNPPNPKITPDSAVKGPENAPVVVFEFTDFQCPWCKKSQENVKAMESAHGTNIRMVDKMFPLTSIHPRAMPSAEAVYCAKEQGKYWEYREKLFDSSPALEDSDFKRIAKELGLKEQKFNQCLTTHATRAHVDADMVEAQAFGVRGTPAFFVNGAQVSFQQLSETVKTELAKKK